jgi:hypothetical protein
MVHKSVASRLRSQSEFIVVVKVDQEKRVLRLG